MPETDTLLLIGHGSSRYANAGDILRRQAAALRERGFRVAAGFLNGAPSVVDALAGVTGPVRAVPFFMEDGYFTRVAIPRLLHGRNITLCPPAGVHPAMPALIEGQARRACDTLGLRLADVAIVLIGHGSSSAPGRALALHDHARHLRAAGCFACVEAACLEEPPFVADVLRGSRATPLIAIGCFANLGLHVRDDVPALLDAERAARAAGRDGTGAVVHFAGTVMDDPALAGMILDQAGYGERQSK